MAEYLTIKYAQLNDLHLKEEEFVNSPELFKQIYAVDYTEKPGLYVRYKDISLELKTSLENYHMIMSMFDKGFSQEKKEPSFLDLCFMDDDGESTVFKAVGIVTAVEHDVYNDDENLYVRVIFRPDYFTAQLNLN